MMHQSDGKRWARQDKSSRQLKQNTSMAGTTDSTEKRQHEILRNLERIGSPYHHAPENVRKMRSKQLLGDWNVAPLEQRLGVNLDTVLPHLFSLLRPYDRRVLEIATLHWKTADVSDRAP